MTNNTNPGMLNDIVWEDMPFTSAQVTREQFEAWLASRKEAGRVIDIDTCEILRRGAYDWDPYGAHDDLPPEAPASATRYVRSPTSNGWINERDLPGDKFDAMRDRIERNQGLWEAACAMHQKFEAGGLWQWKWKGDGDEPSPDAMREWFKTNHPALAREAEREIRARIKEKRKREREQADDIEWTPPF